MWQQRWEKNRRDRALSVEQVNRARCAYDIGCGGAQIGWLRLCLIDRSGIDRELSHDLRGFGIHWLPRWRKKWIDEQAGTVSMGTRGYFSIVHANVEQGTPSTQAEGKSMQEGEELNKNGCRMAKAMNRDSWIKIKREREESKQPSWKQLRCGWEYCIYISAEGGEFE